MMVTIVRTKVDKFLSPEREAEDMESRVLLMVDEILWLKSARRQPF